jgi:uncharacterized protein (DUF58 family)
MKSLLKFIQIYKSTKQHATLFSLVVVILLFGLFLEAYMHDFNLVYITLFFIFSLAFSAGPLGVLNLGYLDAKFIRSGRFFAKTEGKIPIGIYNASTTTSWSVILHHEDISVPLTKLKGETSTTLSIPFTPDKRGFFKFKDCYLESKYPLSTARLTRTIDDSYKGLAYPQPKGKALRSFLSEKESHYGEEKEFDGLRPYDGSQKLSHIHWASVAKGELSVKVFTKETQTPNLVFLFQSLEGDKETRLSQLCLWTLECEKLGMPFSIHMPRRVLSSSKESIDEILEILAQY